MLDFFRKYYKKIVLVVVFFAILSLGGTLRLYKLGEQSFIADEYLGINASYGYYKTGEWKFWDFNENKITDRAYTRANVYYWQVAQVFKFLPANEANARLISVLWGMVGMVSIFIVSYLVTKNLFIAFLAMFLASISISSLIFDRKLRMYAMLAPIYFWLSYAIFYFLESRAKHGIEAIKKITDKTGLNWNFLPAVIVLGVVSLLTHLLTVNIFPAILVYLAIMFFINYRENKKIFNKYSFLFGSSLLLAFFVLNLKAFKGAFDFFSWGVNSWSYLDKITLDYSHLLLALVFLAIGCIYFIKKHSKIGLWTVLSWAVPLFLAIMTWKRSAGDQYIFFIQYFKIVIMAGGIFYTAKTIADKIFDQSKKWLSVLIALFLILLINFSFFSSKESFYGNRMKWNHSNYREVLHYFLKHKKDNSVLIVRPATNFYIWGSNSNIIEFNEGENERLTIDKIKKAQEEFDDVWIIFSRTYYIEGEAKEYFRKNFEKLETTYTNDNLRIWRWEKSNNLR